MLSRTDTLYLVDTDTYSIHPYSATPDSAKGRIGGPARTPLVDGTEGTEDLIVEQRSVPTVHAGR